MTRKDYVKFAKLFAGELANARASNDKDRIGRVEQVQVIILSTADIFAHDSEQFDRERFYAACEPKKN